MTADREGYVEVEGGRVWYRIVGDGPGVPLLTVHGGPGGPHDYFEPLAALADERPVIFYDQLGCGKSDQPDDASLWRIGRFVDELAAVRAAIGLPRLHLLGHSWGTMLAVEYLLQRPQGIASVVLADPAISCARFAADAVRLRDLLPPDVVATMQVHEAAGTTDSEEYQAAMMAFYANHVCRLDPWPEPALRSFAALNPAVYNTMWGPAEFLATGNLKEYDRTDRISELEMPVLFLCGRYDEATPEATQWYRSLVPGSELVIFEESSHLPHLEEPARYERVVRDFLRRAEPAA